MILCSQKSIDKDDIGGGVNILKSGYLTHGSRCLNVKNDVKDFFNVNYAIADSKSNRGLHL